MADKSGPQSVFWALFSLKGRIRRATFGLGIALIFSIWWVAMSQMFATSEGSDQFETWALILGLIILASNYCIYALCHKRLQDIGYPGYYALLAIPLAPFLTGFMILPFALLAFVPGTKDDNKWGPPPVR